MQTPTLSPSGITTVDDRPITRLGLTSFVLSTAAVALPMAALRFVSVHTLWAHATNFVLVELALAIGATATGFTAKRTAALRDERGLGYAAFGAIAGLVMVVFTVLTGTACVALSAVGLFIHGVSTMCQQPPGSCNPWS
ncbi:MAG: hypothetical protein ACRD0Z_02525 [Acidimicrobiales bacterium]